MIMLWSYAYLLELPLSSCYGEIGFLMLLSCAYSHAMQENNRYPPTMELHVSSCYEVTRILMQCNCSYHHVME